MRRWYPGPLDDDESVRHVFFVARSDNPDYSEQREARRASRGILDAEDEPPELPHDEPPGWAEP